MFYQIGQVVKLFLIKRLQGVTQSMNVFLRKAYKFSLLQLLTSTCQKEIMCDKL